MEIFPEALAESFLRVARRLRRETSLRTAPLGLNLHQSRALRVIGDAGPLRPSEVAERLGIVARSATDAVAGLVTSGFVERTHRPGGRQGPVARPLPRRSRSAREGRADPGRGGPGLLRTPARGRTRGAGRGAGPAGRPRFPLDSTPEEVSPLDRFGADVILAIAVAVWFVASGIAKLAGAARCRASRSGRGTRLATGGATHPWRAGDPRRARSGCRWCDQPPRPAAPVHRSPAYRSPSPSAGLRPGRWSTTCGHPSGSSGWSSPCSASRWSCSSRGSGTDGPHRRPAGPAGHPAPQRPAGREPHPGRERAALRAVPGRPDRPGDDRPALRGGTEAGVRCCDRRRRHRAHPRPASHLALRRCSRPALAAGS